MAFNSVFPQDTTAIVCTADVQDQPRAYTLHAMRKSQSSDTRFQSNVKLVQNIIEEHDSFYEPKLTSHTLKFNVISLFSLQRSQWWIG